MIKIIGGENTYESKSALDNTFKQLLKKQEDVLVVSAEEFTDLDRAFSSSQNLGLFGGGSKIVVIKYFELADKEYQEKLLTAQENAQFIVYFSTKLDKRSRLYKFAKSKGKVEEYAPLKSSQLRTWLVRYSKELGINLTNQQISKLLSNSAATQELLVNELEKLNCLSQKSNGHIDEADFLQIVSTDLESTIWDLVDLISTGDKSAAFTSLDRLSKDVEYEYIFAMIARQIRLIYLGLNATSSKHMTEFGVNPFVASKIFRVLARFNLEKVKKLYRKLTDIDIAVKSGKLDKNLALDMLVLVF